MPNAAARDYITTLLAAVRDALIVLDAAGAIVDVSDRVTRMTGYTRDELVGRTPPFPFSTDGVDAVTATWGEPQGESSRATLVHKDGRPLVVDVTSTPVPGGGRVLVFAPSEGDGRGGDDGETERNRLARGWSESDELSRAILSSHPAQLAMLDGDGNIIAVNEAWRKFALENGGGETTGCVGTNYLSVCNEATGEFCDEAPAAVQGIRRVLAGELPMFQLEYPCHAPDRERWFLLTAAPLNRPGGGAIVTHLDITQRKEQEKALRRHVAETAGLAEQLKRSNEELDQFAYITSHDLRAPLRGIANLAAWIEEDLGPAAVTPEAKHMLQQLRGRVTRMEGLIDGILEYSRIGRTGSKRRAERVDVGRLLTESLDLLGPPPPGVVTIGPGMPVLHTDRLQLQQVFMNLLGNAIKHAGRSDPRVTVDCRDLDHDRGDAEVGAEADGDERPRFVEFAVADNGQGIDPRYHDRIFVIFQTLAARDKVEGSGVGLSVVKKIVEGHGGRVWVESQPGQGATFRFTWPRDVSAADGRGPKGA